MREVDLLLKRFCAAWATRIRSQRHHKALKTALFHGLRSENAVGPTALADAGRGEGDARGLPHLAADLAGRPPLKPLRNVWQAAPSLQVLCLRSCSDDIVKSFFHVSPKLRRLQVVDSKLLGIPSGISQNLSSLSLTGALPASFLASFSRPFRTPDHQLVGRAALQVAAELSEPAVGDP